MQEKIIQLPFNRTRFIASQKNSWRFSTNRIYKSYIIYTVLAILFFAVNLKTDSFGQIIGIGFSFYMLLAWIGLIERRFKFFKNTKIHADRFEKDVMDCTYIFNDSGIEYKDKEKMFRLSWHLFKPFESFKDHIYIKLKGQNMVMFNLSRQELGDDGYSELYVILEEKIG
jgi:hypothetical protein